jgi:hypothetical protein
MAKVEFSNAGPDRMHQAMAARVVSANPQSEKTLTTSTF